MNFEYYADNRIISFAEQLPCGLLICCAEGMQEIVFANSLAVSYLGCKDFRGLLSFTSGSFRKLCPSAGVDFTDSEPFAFETVVSTAKGDSSSFIFRVKTSEQEDGRMLTVLMEKSPVMNQSEIAGTAVEGSQQSDSSAKGFFLGTNILLVDDNNLTRELNRQILEYEGATVVEASNGLEALDKFLKFPGFDMILMDIVMPEMDGKEATAGIRDLERRNGTHVPIIAITADKNDETVRDIMLAGADSCVSKPLAVSEVSGILISCMKKNTARMEKRLEDTIRVANTDPLTHVKNVAAYTEKIASLTAGMRRNRDYKFGIVMCDINSLKLENDTNGHDSGDRYIINSCKIICDVFDHSPVYRIGGDEFVVVLQGRDYDNAEGLMERLRERNAIASRLGSVAEGRASFAAGLAIYDRETDETVGDTVKRADTLMYRNKAELSKVED